MKIYKSADGVAKLIPLLSKKHCFVKFHAKWCGHCKAMQKDWDKMIESFKKDTYLEIYDYTGDDEVIIAEIDSDDMTDVPSSIKSKIRGYPTILELQDGEIVSEYSGDRTHNDLYIWILINADPKERKAPEPAPTRQVRPAPARQVRPEPTPQARPAPARQARPEPTPQARPAPTPQVRPEPTPQVRPAPTPQVRPEPTPQVRPEPTPQVRPAPAQQVRPSPAQQARPAPAQQVRPEPVPQMAPRQRMQQRFSMVGNQFYW